MINKNSLNIRVSVNADIQSANAKLNRIYEFRMNIFHQQNELNT